MRQIAYWLAGIVVIASAIVAWRYCDKVVDSISVVGSVASVIGIAIAIEQSAQTRLAAVAAKEATEKANRQMRSSAYRYSLFDARKLLGETCAFVSSKKWKLSALRVGDLADRLSHLASSRPDPDEFWQQASFAMSGFQIVFDQFKDNSNGVYDRINWTDWCSRMKIRIELECEPFGDIESQE